MNLIVTHDHVDFDALAAAVGAAKIYPGSLIALPEPLHANVRSFVNLHRDMLPLLEIGQPAQILREAVIVDTRKKSRLGIYLDWVLQAEKIYIYDHHPQGEDDLEGDEAVLQSTGAATTLLVEKIRKKNLSLSRLEATLMLLGIYEDTGCLTNSSTTPRDAAAAAYLWASGIQAELIQDYLRAPLTTALKLLLEKLVKDSEYYHIRLRRLLLCTATMDEYVRGAAGLFRYLQEMEEVDLAVILVLMDQSVYLAARALSDDLNLAELLAPLGVKGHHAAVSASLKNSSLAEIKEQLLQLLEQFMPPAATVGQALSTPVERINSDYTVNQASEFLYERGISGCPVMEEGKLAGIISRRDLQKVQRSGLGHAPVKAFMRRPVATVMAEDSLVSARRLMAERNVGRLIVLDQEGGPAGIITRSDILNSLYNLDRRKRPELGPERVFKVSSPAAMAGVDNMAELISVRLPAKLQSLLFLIGQRATKLESKAYLVGGVIRDLLLDRPPEQDLDFVVLPDAIALARELETFLNGKLKVFEKFGTASLFLAEGVRLDFVTARREIYAAPAALPQVESSSLRSDLYRRDFTINTLACSLMPDNYGHLYDFFGGREDLSRGLIRSLYHLSFVDDPLRIIRAARFEARFGFDVEDETRALLKKAVYGKVLEKLSRQRLNNELSLVYREEEPLKVLKKLSELGAIPFLYYRLQPNSQSWQRLGRISEALTWASGKKWSRPLDTELLYLCGLLYDLGAESRSAVMIRMQFSRGRTETVLTSCRLAPALLEELSQERICSSEIVNRLDPLPAETLVLIYALTEERKIKAMLNLYLESLKHIRPHLKGDDLKRLGVEPGPLFGRILNKLKEAVLDGKVRNPSEELEYVSWLGEQFKESKFKKEG